MAVGGAMVDPYATLNVPTTAPTAAIRSSYKRLMLQCHPDKVHDEALRAEKAAQFEKVQEAYELLIDPRRRRKYDEEMQRSGSAAAATASAGPGPAPPTARRSASGPMGAASTEEEQTRERERAARHERRRRKAEERGSKGEAGFNTQEEQNARQEARRYAAQQEEANRMAREAKYAQANAETRRQEETRARKSHTSARYAHGTGSSVDDTGTSPRKSSTFTSPPSSYPKSQPPPPPPPREPKTTSQAPQQPSETKVRAGYEEKLREEQDRLNAAKAKMASELGSGGHSPHAGHSSRPSPDDFFAQQQQHAAARAAEMQRQAAQAEMHRQELERERIRMEQVRLDSERASRQEEEKRQQRAREKALKKERERAQAQQESERRQTLFRNADMPSPSPPNRRSSHSTASRDDSSFSSTPQNRLKDFHIPSSAPFGPNNLRRRHSISESPSLEKQQEKQQTRMQRERAAGPTTPAAAYGQTGNCDSGYSSPSPDTSTSTPEKKMMPQNPIVRNGADGTPGSAPWKKYTFEVYVREDEANPANTPPHPHNRRKQSSSGSPSVHPAEIPHMSAHSAGPPLPPDFFTKTTGISGTPYIYPIHNTAHHPSSSVGGVPIENPFTPGSPGSQYTTSRGPASHTSSTGSTSSPRMGRQHSHRHEHHYSSSPKSSSDAFTPHAGGTGPIPMPPRSSTYSHPPSSGSRQRTDIYSSGPGTFPTHPASFNRSGTWG